MRFEFLNIEDIDHFINCALKIEKLQKNNTSHPRIKWFVITDQSDKIQNLIRNYEHKILFVDDKIGHIAYDPNAYEKTILDIELLSYCDEIILTGGSTFGFIGSIKRQKRPYFVEGKRTKNECKLLDFSKPARKPNGFSTY